MLAGSAGASLAFAGRVPNEDAIALSPVAGWIMLAIAVCIALILVLGREAWRRLLFRLEDPRPMGLFRIVFGLCAMANINGLWEHFTYLFTDEGIFLTDVARQVFARQQFEGFGNGLGDDPSGFFDWAGFFAWLKGPKYSLLLLWDTPLAFWIHWAAFQLAMTMLVFGVWTKWVKWVAWFLFHSIILRNNLFWEGTENVYRTLFFYLCLSGCGRAYSVDNWLRCRRLRRHRRLSERDGPGGGRGVAASEDYPKGLEPIFLPIPTWPRVLVMLQIATLYLYTGVVKNGGVWMNGDAFYYALNLDHFWRVPPQYPSSILGTNMFRVMSHVTHWWEVFFPLVIVGLVGRWILRERLPRMPNLQRRLLQLAWGSLALLAGGLVLHLYPVHSVLGPHGPLSIRDIQYIVGGSWLVGLALVAWVYHRLRYRPFRFRILGRNLALDLPWFYSWIFGRRLWLLLGLTFHGHLIVLMNIGWFSPGVLAGYVCFLNGSEVGWVGAQLGRVLAVVGVPGIRAWVRKGGTATLAADLELPRFRRDGVRLPLANLLVAIVLGVLGVVAAYRDLLSFGWSLAGIAAFLAGSLGRERLGTKAPEYSIVPTPRRKDRWPQPPDRSRSLAAPWAYGPIGRLVVGCMFAYHITGVAVWLLPNKDSFKQWRSKARQPFKWWLTVTQTSQGWKMFAPNPPRANLFMRVLVTDASGEVYDLNRDVYAEGWKPIPWIWYSREGKINRRIAGAEGGHGSWYRKWHARYICRWWTLEHHGEIPKQVEIVKLTYGIPSPESVAKHGPYDHRKRLKTHGRATSMYKARCETETGAQVPNVIRERYGLPPVDNVRRWSALRGKQAAWQRKQKRRAERAQAQKSRSSE